MPSLAASGLANVVAYSFVYADATAREADTGFTAADTGKLARQLSNNSLWMLIDDSPVTWIAVGGGGGCDSTLTAAYGSRPAPSNDGNLFLPSDGYTVERDTGTAYVPWGPLFPFTRPPAAADFTANRTGATLTEDAGALVIRRTGAMSGYHRAAPATPYTITAAVLLRLIPTNFSQAGLLFRDSGTGNFVRFNVVHNNGWQWQVDKVDTNGTFVAAYLTTPPQFLGGILWLRIADDGTNRICSYAVDGRNFHVLHTVGRTDYITAN